ncbi:probable glycerol-3-phosphate acyltransferase 3 [Cajanus cajan]|uniref:Glycerol-3-phosphate acyltransferase 3 n=1 Tax=Cajanus cajan TaxID=3821 RepID=A0A151SMU2_CAJCA|nr:probable glycerol-3-phosphate acyltransferase 3 [Cajanus cajan]KYP56156.1 putative glycerol-3-phosphate acyltransferase 3 [Cajanus cajan]
MAKLFRAFFFKSLFFFWYRFLLRQLRNLIRFHRTISNSFSKATQNKYQKFPSLLHRSDLHDHTLIFDVENTLLKSSSLFPYFMLVAFEAGGLLRAIVLVLLYPFVCVAGEDMGLKIMVMACFFGIKASNFRVGRSVLPKFFLEDVGAEIFEVLNRGGKKVGVTNLPQVMVESFLREYLEIDFVVGRELKMLNGYYVGLMDDTKTMHALEQVKEGKGCSDDMIGITRFHNIRDHQIFSQCKEVYVVTGAEKRRWEKLARERYPKAVIFHDGRLALRLTPLESIAMLMWVPYGIILAVIRIALALSLPFKISTPLLIMSGLRLTVSAGTPRGARWEQEQRVKDSGEGILYVCNHRTLLDPLYISYSLQKKLTAVTYSLSRMSEILAPIKTVRLTRKREEDAKMMKELLGQGDLVVCPEGTTCREPYLLRFSPLFSEMCDEIAPVAVDSHVTMFHGTTAGGFKCLDPLFFLMNPSPVYTVRLLDRFYPSPTHQENTRFEVANAVQTQIGQALGFECTKLTRKDKYLMLAGNEGIVSNAKSS